MKSKYSTISQYKKSIVERIERRLADINNQIAAKLAEKDLIEQEIFALSFPPSSQAIDFKFVQDIFIIKSIEKNEKLMHLMGLEEDKNEIARQHKLAMLELEKIKYLETLELTEYKTKLKKAEEKDLNEISVMLFNNKGIFQ